MLTGPSEQDLTATLDLLGRHLCVREEKCIWLKFRGFYCSVISSGPWWGACWYSFWSEGQDIVSGPSYNPERGTMPSEPLWILESTHSPFRCVTSAYLPSDPKSCWVCVGPRKREASAPGSCCCAGCSATWAVWSSRSNDACSGSGRQGWWLEPLVGPYTWITPRRPLEFWSKALPSSADNYFLLKK